MNNTYKYFRAEQKPIMNRYAYECSQVQEELSGNKLFREARRIKSVVYTPYFKFACKQY